MYNENKISKKMFDKLLKQKKKEIFITKPSPPFKDVLDKYESIRAKCSKKAKSCVIKKKTTKLQNF